MGQVRICDKCKKVLKFTPDTEIKIYVHPFGDVNYELCAKCSTELREWLESENPFSKLRKDVGSK